MDGRFSNPYGNKQVEPRITSEFPFSGVVSRGKITSTASPKRSRRGVQKRVVSIPIGDVHGSRLKGDGTPPSDSWAWRKYGQKPIKGSPYPRGYYRCSSSKGCPARKQVERSRVDPTMLVVTYACEHNHPGPASRNPSKAKPTSQPQQPEEEPAVFSTEPKGKFSDLADDSLITADDFSWFSDASVSASASSSHFSLLDSPVCGGSNSSGTDDADLAMIFPLGEEDESLFADLGELPECSAVFRRGCIEEQEERRRCTLKAG